MEGAFPSLLSPGGLCLGPGDPAEVSAQGTGRGLTGGFRQWWKELWCGVCPAGDTHPLACSSPSSASHGDWRASTRTTTGCSPGSGAMTKAAGALCHDSVTRCAGEAKSTETKSSHRRKTEKKKNPFWEGMPWACPQPAPAELGARPRYGHYSHSKLTFPSALQDSGTQKTVGTRATGRCVDHGSAQTGLVFSQSVSPGCGSQEPVAQRPSREPLWWSGRWARSTEPESGTISASRCF